MHNSRPTANFNTNVNYSASYTLDFNAAVFYLPERIYLHLQLGFRKQRH